MARHAIRMTGRRIRIPQDKTRTFAVGEPDMGTLVFISERHVRNGVVKDPWNCAIANSACETMGAAAAMIGATIAYIIVRLDGEMVALRYSVPTKTRRAIDHFDATGEMPAEGFRLLPVRDSDRADSKRMKNKRERARWLVPTKGRPATGLRALKSRNVRNASNEVITIQDGGAR